MTGTVISIHVADTKGGALRPLAATQLEAGKGIPGDRRYREEGQSPERELTLVEAEQIARFNSELGVNIEPHDVRRNIVTRGVSLNDLVGKEFRVGAVRVRGIELCEPCKYMAEMLVAQIANPEVSVPGIVKGLTHRAGLRARILESGTARVGDAIEVTTP